MPITDTTISGGFLRLRLAKQMYSSEALTSIEIQVPERSGFQVIYALGQLQGDALKRALRLIQDEIKDLEPIREVWIHDEGFAASRLSMMRIMARRTKAATVMA